MRWPVRDDGTLWGWGYNWAGQLGDGTLLSRSVPTPIQFDWRWTSVSCGFAHTVAIRDDGTLWAWGYGANGRLGIGPWQKILDGDLW